ncbi:chorismate mutase [Xylocopilactobacillus apicola]|uniref:Chorismate mutase domain-containing protein n=1 Tax=Xylocopilactobacillus apicola TaxID=2932184 RepID=A0AAU9DHP3_9LACO|nr:chorismate mutase [Xylocopilactobacillus apicola]BDR59550.1 hypothetical protein XA3_19910 [Xylocopilactobacillus apicola]
MTEREQIDQIDHEMTVLFTQRMQLSKKIAAAKFAAKAPVSDRKREEEIIKNELAKLPNDELKSYLRDFYRDVFLISKQYQAKLIKGWRDKNDEN